MSTEGSGPLPLPEWLLGLARGMRRPQRITKEEQTAIQVAEEEEEVEEEG